MVLHIRHYIECTILKGPIATDLYWPVAKQHDQNIYDKDAPATLRVLFVIGTPSAVTPLHCTTVPFRLAGELIVRVEIISAMLVFITVMRFAVFVKVATKSMLSHCGGETPLQSTLLPTHHKSYTSAA